MSLSLKTQSLQQELAQYCREKEQTCPTSIPPDRASVYKRLVFNNIEQTLKSAFPITCSFLKERWLPLIHDFFSQHNSPSPYLWKMPEQLHLFVKEKNLSEELQIPFLWELLFFEWLEIEVHMMPDENIPSITPSSNPLQDLLVLNPYHHLHHFSYPVFSTCPQQLFDKKGHYFLLAYRTLSDKQVAFIEVSQLHAYLLKSIQDSRLNAEEILDSAAKLLNIKDSTTLQRKNESFLVDLLEKEVILGTYAYNNRSHPHG